MRFALSAMCRCDGACWCVRIPAYACPLMFMWRVSISATLTPAGDTWPCCCCCRRHRGLCCERLYGLAERGDPLCGSPRRRGASCTSLFAPFGPLCLWPPCSDPLGSTKCSWTSALSTSWWREKTTLRSSFLSVCLHLIIK